jgi:hypothetical protein
MSEHKFCLNCLTEEKPLFHCKGCNVRYCSKECQTVHWKIHWKNCYTSPLYKEAKKQFDEYIKTNKVLI